MNPCSQRKICVKSDRGSDAGYLVDRQRSDYRYGAAPGTWHQEIWLLDDAMLMNVGRDEVRVTTLTGSAVERKVPLPERWLKGFAEVQVASAQMLLRHELSTVEARRFLH
jgi:hypothetical protein